MGADDIEKTWKNNRERKTRKKKGSRLSGKVRLF